MNKSTTPSPSYRFSARAALAAMGIRLRGLPLFGPVRDHVHITQKVVKHTPVQTLSAACIPLLAGAHGLVEINTRRRADPGLPAAVGRMACAAPSVVQETRETGTATNGAPRHQAMASLYRQPRRGYRPDYPPRLPLLAVAMTGMPCGKTAAVASTGDCATQRHRRGRQLGRVLATRDDDSVVERLVHGTTQLTTALPPLAWAAEQPLAWDDDPRRRTLWRIAAGGGSGDEVNWLWGRGDQGHCQDDSGPRAPSVAERVTEWGDDPRLPERQGGGVTGTPTA